MLIWDGFIKANVKWNCNNMKMRLKGRKIIKLLLFLVISNL